MTHNARQHSPSRLVSFLLVEDDDDHAALVLRSLKNYRIVNRIDHVRDGAEALDFLFQQGKFVGRQKPDIILLDLKLPKVDGHEVLRQIKNDHHLKIIPVVVLTTSRAEIDRAKAYAEHANSYLVKPLNFAKFREMAEELKLYWGMWNEPPIEPERD